MALTAISVALALMCAYMAVAWSREHRRVECYRDQAEEGLIPDRKCERYRPATWRPPTLP